MTEYSEKSTALEEATNEILVTKTIESKEATLQLSDDANDDVKLQIYNKLECISSAIKEKDMKQLSNYVHPINGLRISGLGVVDLENDIVLQKNDVEFFLENDYMFRCIDGIHDGMPYYRDKGINYFNEKIYYEDFSQARIAYNGYVELDYYPTSKGNHFDIYKGAKIIELYFKSKYSEYPQDWKIIRFIFESYNNDWFLIGIITDEWTP